MQRITIGVVCLARTTFDWEEAGRIYARARENLKKIPEIDWVFEEELVIEVGDAQKAAARLQSRSVDGVVVISGTFHLGHLALIIDRVIRKPVLLWGFNELPYNGGKIRLNSVCGVNLNASNLYKAGNDRYSCIVADDIDAQWVDALRIKIALERAHFGLVGFRAHGFFNLAPDELRNFTEAGVLLDHYEIADMFGRDVADREAEEEESRVRSLFSCDRVADEQVRKVARLCAAVRRFIAANGLDATAVRCWPEYAAEYGIAPCAMMSILQSLGHILACEGDIEGSMSMLALRAAGAETPFLADLSQIDFKNNFALMWHCGVAPANLWDGTCERGLDTYFAGGKGVTADFVMKPGPVNVVRIDSARGRTRLFLAKGEAVPMEKLLKGTYAKVRFERHVSELVDTVTAAGVAHHVAMAYGDYMRTFEKFAKMQNWEIIRG
ncbi:MAG: fucose isomerase [Planctomycetota bacterium]|nr:fucose isomerase [Planctomycetota bacterium]